MAHISSTSNTDMADINIPVQSPKPLPPFLACPGEIFSMIFTACDPGDIPNIRGTCKDLEPIAGSMLATNWSGCLRIDLHKTGIEAVGNITSISARHVKKISVCTLRLHLVSGMRLLDQRLLDQMVGALNLVLYGGGLRGSQVQIITRNQTPSDFIQRVEFQVKYGMTNVEEAEKMQVKLWVLTDHLKVNARVFYDGLPYTTRSDFRTLTDALKKKYSIREDPEQQVNPLLKIGNLKREGRRLDDYLDDARSLFDRCAADEGTKAYTTRKTLEGLSNASVRTQVMLMTKWYHMFGNAEALPPDVRRCGSLDHHRRTSFLAVHEC
jgi:hypothetical protein